MSKEPNIHNDYFEIKNMLIDLYDKRLCIAIISLILIFLWATFLLMLPNKYEAKTLLFPNKHESISKLPSSISSLSSLAGVNLRNEDSITDLAIERLESFSFFLALVKKHGDKILIPLIAADGFNNQTKELTIDSKIYDTKTQKWQILSNKKIRSRWNPDELSIQFAFKKYLDSIKISQSRNSQIITLHFEHFSPFFAKEFMEMVVNELNLVTINEEIKKKEQANIFLKDQLSRENSNEIRNTLSSLITENYKSLSLFYSSEDYVFLTLDEPLISEYKSGPPKTLFAIIGSTTIIFLVTFIFIIAFMIRNIKLNQG